MALQADRNVFHQVIGKCFMKIKYSYGQHVLSYSESRYRVDIVLIRYSMCQCVLRAIIRSVEIVTLRLCFNEFIVCVV